MLPFAEDRVCQHTTRIVYLDSHGYDADGHIIEKITAVGCAYVYLVGDFNFSHVPDNDQLLVAPFIMRPLHLTEIGECTVGLQLSEDDGVEEITGVKLCYILSHLYD